MNEILDRPLHQLAIDDIRLVRQLANTLFIRLVQPFRQNRVVWDFDTKATIRSAMRTGHMLPTYTRHEKTHAKSQLVIAMSLSGIDRCFAVGLIPLLAQLRKYLQFRLFIYTDDLIEAEFGSDGYISNDCDIAWNNVVAPVVFSRLEEMTFDAQETKLLLIDSLGGGDSEWYQSVDKNMLAQVQETQSRFVGGPWANVRKELKGQYDLFNSLPSRLLPLSWQDKVDKNCGSRWVQTPALREYLIHYIFNPKFGEREHGSYYPQHYDPHRWNGSVNIRSIVGRLKEKFKSVHLLTPSCGDESEGNLDLLNRYRFLDFHHKADTLEGFAQTLINIVYGRETNKLTLPVIKFAQFYQMSEVMDETETGGDHSELTKTAKDCFAYCEPAKACMPPGLHKFMRHKRGTYEIEEILVPYNNIDVKEFFDYGTIDTLMGDWRIDPLWAEYGKKLKAAKALTFIKENFIRYVPSEYSSGELVVYSRRHYEPDVNWDNLFNGIEYQRHRTRALRPVVEETLGLYSKVYHPWFERLPLKHVVWCTVGKFKFENMAISASPADAAERQKATVYHETAHWAEHVCPQIGVFTNNLLEYWTGDFDANKVVPVGVGEFARPASRSHTPWLVEYAGKWYRRHDKDLPNPTEVFSVHMEFFRSEETLLQLLEHDPFMAKVVAFILMGGPVALVEQCQARKRKKAMDEIDQRERKSTSYAPKSDGGKKGKKKKDSDMPAPTPKIVEESKSFGI